MTVEYHFFDFYAPRYSALPDGTPLYGFDEFNSFDQLKDSKAVFLNTTFELNSQFTLQACTRYTKDQVTISNFYAPESWPLAPGPTAHTPDAGGMGYWAQTTGSPPANLPNCQP